MNIQKYASIYAQFHDAISFEMIEDIIVLPFADVQWIKSIVLKLRFFNKIIHGSKKPLINAFKAHFKTDAIATVFDSNDSSSILIGNERVVYPDAQGKCRLCATPFYIRDPKLILHYLEGVTKTLHDHVYLYKNSVLYLDEYDVPRPGTTYFDNFQESDGFFRLCFLTSEPRHLIESIAGEWRHRRDIVTNPFKTTIFTITISKFIQPHLTHDVYFPDDQIRSTALVHKKLTLDQPAFLLRDILNTFRNNGGKIRDLGLFVEYPLRVGFEGAPQRPAAERQFLPLSINGNQPKIVLHVKSPYDRYTVYAHVPAIAWTNVLYDEPLPISLSRVVVDSTILGYRHASGIFLCLGHPMLAACAKYPNLNTDCILSTNRDFDPFKDPELNVVETYYVDPTRLLHLVKHKELSNELWCLSSQSAAAKKYKKRAKPPKLVEEWIKFVNQNGHLASVYYGDLTVVKLALILAQHKICYSMKQSRHRNVVFHKDKDIVFEMDDDAIKFVNDLRLDSYIEKTNSNASDICSIM